MRIRDMFTLWEIGVLGAGAVTVVLMVLYTFLF